MPHYDSSRYDPPAPVTPVTLQSSTGGPTVPDVQMLIDTGADITLLPRAAVQRTGVAVLVGTRYEVFGADGRSSAMMDAVDLDLQFFKKIFRGRYLLTDSDQGVLGRDVLNTFRILLDGPNQEWRVHDV